jgi:hypothetical protein
MSHQIILMAQIVPDLILDARQDGLKIFKAYMSPLLQRSSSGLNRNWTTSAKIDEVLSFKVSAKFSMVGAGSNSATYNLNDLGLIVLKPVSGSDGIASTIMGDALHNPILEVWKKESNYNILNPLTGQLESVFDPARPIQDVNKLILPKGSSSSWINGKMIGVLPFMQIDAAIPSGTEVSLRYSPSVSLQDISYHLFGYGFKHDLMQWLTKDFSGNTPDKKRSLDLSLQAGYTNVKANYNNPGIALGIQNDYYIQNAYIKSQHVTTNIKAYNVELICSKEFLECLSPFVSIGLSTSSAQVSILGKYPISGLAAGSQTAESVKRLRDNNILIEQNRFVFTDPISFVQRQNEVNSTVGLNTRMFNVLNIGFAATWGRFNSYSIGLSLLTDRFFR